jgi:hypothetical protein
MYQRRAPVRRLSKVSALATASGWVKAPVQA